MSKEYSGNLFFDNSIETENENLSSFSLEAYIRNAAQRMIQAALEAEVAEFLQRARYSKSDAEDFRGYRNGHQKERTVSTTVGGLNVKVPRVSDSPRAFKSQLIKPYKRRSDGLDNLFPQLFIVRCRQPEISSRRSGFWLEQKHRSRPPAFPD